MNEKLLIEAIVLQRTSLAEDFGNALENHDTKIAVRRWDIIGKAHSTKSPTVKISTGKAPSVCEFVTPRLE